MKIRKIFTTLFILSFLCFNLFSINKVSADILPSASGLSECQKIHGLSATECGDYAVNDFVYLAINVSQLILGIVGSLSFLMFIFGGFTFLISAGSSEQVSKAKKIITAAVVGLLIVFSSWLIINFVFKTMGLDWQGEIKTPGKISS